MTFEGFNGKVDNENYSITFSLSYEDDEPSDKQKGKDFKEMCDYIAIAFASYADATDDGDMVSIEKESGTYKFEG